MCIIRIRHEKRFTTLANQAIQDVNLSLAARGLHHLLLSYPDNWEVRVSHLQTVCKEGRQKIYTLLKELEENGYVMRSQERLKNGTFGKSVYEVYELPLAEIEKLELEQEQRQSRKISNGSKSYKSTKSNKQKSETIAVKEVEPQTTVKETSETAIEKDSLIVNNAENITQTEVEPSVENQSAMSIYLKNKKEQRLSASKETHTNFSSFGSLGHFESEDQRSDFYDWMVSKLTSQRKTRDIAQRIAGYACNQVQSQNMTESTKRDFQQFKEQNNGGTFIQSKTRSNLLDRVHEVMAQNKSRFTHYTVEKR